MLCLIPLFLKGDAKRIAKKIIAIIGALSLLYVFAWICTVKYASFDVVSQTVSNNTLSLTILVKNGSFCELTIEDLDLIDSKGLKVKKTLHGMPLKVSRFNQNELKADFAQGDYKSIEVTLKVLWYGRMLPSKLE